MSRVQIFLMVVGGAIGSVIGYAIVAGLPFRALYESLGLTGRGATMMDAFIGMPAGAFITIKLVSIMHGISSKLRLGVLSFVIGFVLCIPVILLIAYFMPLTRLPLVYLIPISASLCQIVSEYMVRSREFCKQR
jgi:ABC-type methionine transport system permease subunit